MYIIGKTLNSYSLKFSGIFTTEITKEQDMISKIFSRRRFGKPFKVLVNWNRRAPESILDLLIEGDQKGIIINGASSSVGSFAVQLAKRAGLFVIGVAGSSKDYAKSLGADVIIDYRDHQGDALVSSSS